MAEDVPTEREASIEVWLDQEKGTEGETKEEASGDHEGSLQPR